MPPRRPYSVRDVEALRKRMATSKRVVPHSVRSLADQVNSNRGTINALLTGEQATLSEELAQRIAYELGVPMEDLFMPTVIAFANTNEASGNGSPGRKEGARDE
jgi:transcriptional regulator with XRE-family HTH domain